MRKLTIFLFLLTFNVFSQHDESRISQLRKEVKIDGQDKVVFDLLEEFYLQVLQSDLGKLNPDMSKKIDKTYNNKRTKNRHLLLMFMAYQEHISQTIAKGQKSNTQFQVDLMTDLAYEFKKIYNKVPAIIYIYKFEALDSNKQDEEALKTIEEGLTEYPNSIPMKIYKFQISKIDAIKTDLINNHSNHWMVKQFEIR